MTVLETVRFLLKKYTSGGDPHPTRAEHNAMIDTIENNAAMYSQGITDARPAAGKIGRFFFDSTAGIKRLWWDDGANWNDLNPNGGGGAGSKITPGFDGVEGISNRSARADHSHRLDLATPTTAGAMPAFDRMTLAGATSGATGNALVKRDANARIEINTPTTAFHATTKGYVDGEITLLANYVDGHVGPGLTVTRYAPLAPAGYSAAGDIWTYRLPNMTVVTGNVAIKRNPGTNKVFAGGTVLYESVGQIIPTALLDPRDGSQIAGIMGVSNLIGAAQYDKIQWQINQGSGGLNVRGDSSSGITWKPGDQLNLSFTYLVAA